MGCDVRPFRQPQPSRHAGLNHFSWDLRYPGAVSFDCLIFWGAFGAAGPKAPPGQYQVRLTANGKALTEKFEVRRDPRLKRATDDDLAAQFALARQILEKENAANGAVVKIRALRDGVDDRVVKSSGLAAQGSALKQKLTAIEEELYQTRTRSGQDLLNFPIKLTNRLAVLRQSVDGGDSKPTDASFVVLKELSAELDQRMAELKRVEDADVAAFNRALAARKLEPIGVGR